MNNYCNQSIVINVARSVDPIVMAGITETYRNILRREGSSPDILTVVRTDKVFEHSVDYKVDVYYEVSVSSTGTTYGADLDPKPHVFTDRFEFSDCVSNPFGPLHKRKHHLAASMLKMYTELLEAVKDGNMKMQSMAFVGSFIEKAQAILPGDFSGL